MSFTQADAESLGDKLDALDLTEGERAALLAVFTEAIEESETSGFAYDLNPNDLSFKAAMAWTPLALTWSTGGDSGVQVRDTAPMAAKATRSRGASG